MKKLLYLSLLMLVSVGMSSCKEKSDPEPEVNKQLRISEIKSEGNLFKFIYNDAGCLIKMDGDFNSSLIFEYNSENKLNRRYVQNGTSIEEIATYEYHENLIIYRTENNSDIYEKLYLNSAGQIAKRSVIYIAENGAEEEILMTNFVWEQGNLVHTNSDMEITECKFDEKKSPFQFQFLKFDFTESYLASINNPLELSSEYGFSEMNPSSLLKSESKFFQFFRPKNRSEVSIETYEYDYNSEGYPIRIKNYFDGELGSDIELTYETY